MSGERPREAAGGQAVGLTPVRLDDPSAAALLPDRDARGHKGTFGTLAIVAGSLEYAGAALLAGRAALRAGVGVAVLCVPESLQPVVAGRVPELVTMGLPERSPGEVDPGAAADVVLARGADALLVGSGLHPGRATAGLVRRLIASPDDEAQDEAAGAGPRVEATGTAAVGLERLPAAERQAPCVLDAEALNQLARLPGWWRHVRRPAVLTPHPGEFGRLFGALPADDPAARAQAASEAARSCGQVVVLKGAETIVAASDGRLADAPFALPAMATAGSGDVLAGVIASLLAQGLRPFEAACLGVYLHGLSGRDASERLGDAGVIASDLADGVPRARRSLAERRARGGAGSSLGFGRPASLG